MAKKRAPGAGRAGHRAPQGYDAASYPAFAVTVDIVIFTIIDDALKLIEKYRGGGEAGPPLDRLGGATWTTRKTKVKAKMRDMADVPDDGTHQRVVLPMQILVRHSGHEQERSIPCLRQEVGDRLL